MSTLHALLDYLDAGGSGSEDSGDNTQYNVIPAVTKMTSIAFTLTAPSEHPYATGLQRSDKK
ncbi:unnamed protein product [Protopolystoma xenopodis]|uniref:Uncharacterized protein n=1 Tax=Protopolystoma xenopodis TaxID=117903 RepID=A0A448XR46_9PLAT|nr:unnamed protein product [Protopolystoma xenopodis]